ncbi:MAG TPA: hypothetical protein VEN78_38290 [Bradyrhizobium sp.]|nr:hypothetical protein [Bradyrhizobium sp.]
MTRLKFLGAAAVLSALIATPALAERMIDEPGMYAFYHPNGDLGIGSTRPAEAMASVRGSGNIARLRMGPASRPVLKRAQPNNPY